MTTLHKEDIQHKINFKTKPIGALGQLESLALQICQVQNSLTPELKNPSIFLFAGDHGIANDGVSAYPQEVTWQMVLNFLQGGAAISVFSKQHNIDVHIVDTGVNKYFEKTVGLIHAKVNAGTKSFLHGKAMSEEELEKCFANGKKIIQDFKKSNDCNIIGFGEMGIGNTSAASLIMSCITGIPLENCIGKGTGVNEEQLQHKKNILRQAKIKHSINEKDSFEVLQTFGGFEIASMCSAMLESYKYNMLIIIDGFISSSAFLAAYNINTDIIKNAIFSHQSDENGHALLLEHLKAKALLKLNMRLGEGSACALVYPLIQSAVIFINEMASFESASISNKS